MSTVTTASATREHRVTVRSLAARKCKAEPFTMLTAYDFTFARIFDEAGSTSCSSAIRWATSCRGTTRPCLSPSTS